VGGSGDAPFKVGRPEG